MEDNLIFWKIEDDLNGFSNGRRHQMYSQTEDNFNITLNWKTSITLNGKQIMQPKSIKIATMVVAPLQLTLLLYKYLSSFDFDLYTTIV